MYKNYYIFITNRYLGFDVAEGRDVAWSDLSLEETTEEELEQFNNEVEILRSVNCEYIIHYYDSWDDKKNNKKVIITQYHPSGTIREYRLFLSTFIIDIQKINIFL